jgi:hypothetical protein
LLRVFSGSSIAEFSQVPKRIGQQKNLKYADSQRESCTCHGLNQKVDGGEDQQKEKPVEPEAYLPSFTVIQAVKGYYVQNADYYGLNTV